MGEFAGFVQHCFKDCPACGGTGNLPTGGDDYDECEWSKYWDEMQALREKVERLTSRGFQDLHHENESLHKRNRNLNVRTKTLLSDYVALKKYALHLQKCLDNLETSK